MYAGPLPGCGMSPASKPLDEIFATLASSPAAFERLLLALESLLGDERETADSWARAALLSPTDAPTGCVRLGRVQMLEELIGMMKRHIKQ